MTLPEIHARRNRVVRLRKAGYPIDDIADRVSLSPRQVKRIIANNRAEESRESRAIERLAVA